MKVEKLKTKKEGKIYHRLTVNIKVSKNEKIELNFYPDWYNNIKKIRNPLLDITIKTKEHHIIHEMNVRETKEIMKLFKKSISMAR